MTLERYGFQSGDIILPGIEMPVRLGKGFYFRNYGIVPDLRGKTLQIAQELNMAPPTIDLRQEAYYGASARHLGIIKRGDRGSAVFVKEGLDMGTVIFDYGHESVHAVRNLGLEDQFAGFLRKEGFTLNPFETYSSEEQIAHVGGVLSLHKAGMLWFFSHPEVDPIREDLMASRS
ncbi:MAG: hypothetical protein Q8Q31_05805 [Nanoarchaeota archaeon]|nr:hypothetical protein [Nanoarchaeota archaeon]